MRRAVRVAVVLVVLALPLSWVPPLGAELPATYGWWYRLNSRQTKPLEPPVLPVVPEDGLFVAEDVHPSEHLAISGLAFIAQSGPSATLQLTVAPNSVVGVPLVSACTTTESFFGEQNGEWESRPEPICDLGLAPGELIGDGESMLFSLPKSFEVFTEFWSVLLIPDPQAQPFQIAFEAPDAASFSVDAENLFPSDEPPPPPPSSGQDAPAFDAPLFAPPPPIGAPAGPSVLTDLPEAEAEPAPDPDENVRTIAAPPAEVDDTAARIAAFALLALMAAGLALVARPSLVPALARAPGGEAVVRQRGLGRFVRARDGRPRGLL